MATEAEIQALMDKVGAAKPQVSFGDRIRDGRHLLALRSYTVRGDMNSEGGIRIGADFVVVKSDAHQVGSLVSTAFFVGERGWRGEKEHSKATACARAIIGVPSDATPTQVTAELNKLRSPKQPGTGVLVWANGKTSAPRVSKAVGAAPGTMTKEYTEVSFEHCPNQTMDGKDIKARRAEILASHPMRDDASAKPALQTLPDGWPAMQAVPEGWQLSASDAAKRGSTTAPATSSLLDGIE